MESWDDEFYRGSPTELYNTPYYSLSNFNFSTVTLQWYERPNEDNLLNTLTEILEGAYDYD